MDCKTYSFDELKICLFPVFKKYGVKSAVLFGSYGKGTASAGSDVDLLVDSGLEGLRFVVLIEDIQNALGEKEVDLFDVSHIERGSLIDKEINRTGVKIYEK